MMSSIRPLLPGVLFCCVLALASALIAQTLGGPSLVYALLLGMGLHVLLHSSDKAAAFQPLLSPGINHAAGAVLRFGVALLGLRISLDQILALGIAPLAIVLTSIPATIVCGLMLARLLGMSRSAGALSGGAVAICGASAAMAIAAILPNRPETERQLIFTIIAVTALSTLAMLLYPLLVLLLPLPDSSAGLFLGGTIHNVPQAIAAGFAISDPAGDSATFIKLLRVAMLAPVVIVISLLVARRGHVSSGGATFPGFLLAFVALVAVNSLGWLPEILREPLDLISRTCLLVAIAGIGLKASLMEIAGLGWRPVLLVILETIFLAALVLAGLLFFN